MSNNDVVDVVFWFKGVPYSVSLSAASGAEVYVRLKGKTLASGERETVVVKLRRNGDGSAWSSEAANPSDIEKDGLPEAKSNI